MPRTILIAIVVPSLLGASAAHASFTTGGCFVKKHIVWNNLRNCQRKAQVKQLQGKPADFATCQTKFQEKLAKISAKATNVAIPCRYRDNNDGTVTDYDTGLGWEKKTAAPCDGQGQCVDKPYNWSDAEGFSSQLNGLTDDGSMYTGPFGGFSCLAGFCDWRLPTLLELKGIIDPSVSGCGSGVSCIDPIFGPSQDFFYWSATTFAGNPNFAWLGDFFSGNVVGGGKGNAFFVRAVRTRL